MYKTEFNATDRIWFGTNDEFTFDKNHNFGDTILTKLADEDSDRVIQVNFVGNYKKFL